MFKFCCNYTTKLDFFKPTLFVCEYDTLFLVFFFLLSFLFKPLRKYLEFLLHRLWTFPAWFLLRHFVFLFVFLLWMESLSYTLISPPTHPSHQSVSKCCWLPVHLNAEQTYACFPKVTSGHLLTLGHRLVSTHFQGPVPTHFPEVASYNLWHHTRVSFKVLQWCYTAPKYDPDSQRRTA